jgi:predicted amidohydrolase
MRFDLTFVDAGSAGAFTLQGFRELIVERSSARIHCLLNISSIGLVAEAYELANLAFCEPDLCARLIDSNRDLVLGVKARIDALTVGAHGLEPLRRARRAADACALPLMVGLPKRRSPPLLARGRGPGLLTVGRDGVPDLPGSAVLGPPRYRQGVLRPIPA